MEAGQFSNMNEAVAKFVNSCTDATGRSDTVLYYKNRQASNYRGSNYGYYRGNGNGCSAALKELEVASAIAVEIVIEVDKTTEISEITITKKVKEVMFELLRLTQKTSRTLNSLPGKIEIIIQSS